MRGNITRRGKSSWRLKFDAGSDRDGKRLIQYQTVHGTKKDAEQELAKRLNELGDGRYLVPTADTVEIYARHWLENIAPARRSTVTVERYRTLIETHLVPNIGSVTLQKLDGVALLYAQLRTKGRWFGGGLSPMTLHHVHSALSQILASAVRTKKLARSPIGDVETKPKRHRRRSRYLTKQSL
jgi:integrase